MKGQTNKREEKKVGSFVYKDDSILSNKLLD